MPKALKTTDLPRYYLAAFKKHMLFENQDDAETEYQNIHLAACEELSEAKPEYDPRRLEDAAHPLAMVILVQKDVKELNKEDLTKLFVEVYGHREKFLKVYIEELDKADTVIDEMKQTRRKHSVREEEEEVSKEDIDTKIEKVLHKFEDDNPLEKNSFVKAFIEKDKSQVLEIANTKLDQFDTKLTEMEKLEWSKKAEQTNLDRTRDNPAEAAEKQNTEPNKVPEPTKESCPFCENHYGNKTFLKVHIPSAHFGIGTGNNLNESHYLKTKKPLRSVQSAKR